MHSRQVQKLRDDLNRALRLERLGRALDLYLELEQREPDEPRWAHRKGDLLRRMGQRDAAVASYARAVGLYAAQGFVARAAAMAKVVLDVDPTRIDILERVDPEAARRLLRGARRGTPPTDVSTVSTSGVRSVTLRPAGDAADDELRFDDAPTIDIDLSELEMAAREESHPVFFLDEHEDLAANQLALLPSMPLFADLPDEALQELLLGAGLCELRDGELLMRAGDPADSLYAIVEGSVRVEVPGVPPEEAVVLAEGDVVGESCLLQGVVRRADVRVRGRLVALRIPRELLDDLTSRYKPVRHLLFDLLTRRIVSNLLRTSPLFAPFDLDTRREIARLFETRGAAENTVLIERGKRSDGLYILLAGQLLLERENGRRAVHEPVTIIGQRSLLGHGPSDYNAQTLTQALVLRLPASSFNGLAAGYPPVLEKLTELASAPPAPAEEAEPLA